MRIKTFSNHGARRVFLLSYAHRVGEKQMKLEEVGLFISKAEASKTFNYIAQHSDEQISESIVTMYYDAKDLINPSIPLYFDLENYLARNDLNPEI